MTGFKFVSSFLAFAALAAASSAQSYSAAAAFTDLAAVSGPWAYGYDAGSGFLTYDVVPMHRDFAGDIKGFEYDDVSGPYLAKNFGAISEGWYNGIVVAPGQILTHPGNANHQVRFTSPGAGLFTVSAAMQMADGGSNTFKLFLNGIQVPGSSLALAGLGSTASFSTNLNLNPGDQIDFVGYTGLVFQNAMFIDYNVQAVPEPASFVVLAPALLFLQRRRK